mgnify:CR=1 FL=1
MATVNFYLKGLAGGAKVAVKQFVKGVWVDVPGCGNSMHNKSHSPNFSIYPHHSFQTAPKIRLWLLRLLAGVFSGGGFAGQADRLPDYH